MNVVIHYTKAQYTAKITELEGYLAQLETHLSRMEGLKEKMYTFWDDDNARTAGLVLSNEIRDVKNAMDTTQEMLTFYKSAVEKLEGANIGVSDMLGELLALLG